VRYLGALDERKNSDRKKRKKRASRKKTELVLTGDCRGGKRPAKRLSGKARGKFNLI